MAARLRVSPRTLDWALARSNMPPEDVFRLAGETAVFDDRSIVGSAAVIAELANQLRVPLGWLLLAEPPLEPLPVTDLRSPDRNGEVPSGDLLDTIYLCQQRQRWCREHLSSRENAASVLEWPITADMNEDDAAAILRNNLDLESARKRREDEAFRAVADAIEDSGVMVMVSGIHRNFTHRKFDIREFRCLVMNDDVAPLLFINGRDMKPAQTFTLLHGYLHLCLGHSGVDDVEIHCDSETSTERWCNRVVAAALLPPDTFQAQFNTTVPIEPELERLAKHWKVTPLAVCRQALETELIDRPTFEVQYQRFTEQAEKFAISTRGRENFGYYTTIGARLGKRFKNALIQDTFAGNTLLRDACRLTDLPKQATFMEFARRSVRGDVSA